MPCQLCMDIMKKIYFLLFFLPAGQTGMAHTRTAQGQTVKRAQCAAGVTLDGF